MSWRFFRAAGALALLPAFTVSAIGECEDKELPKQLGSCSRLGKKCAWPIAEVWERRGLKELPENLNNAMVWQYCPRTCVACQERTRSLEGAEAIAEVKVIQKFGKKLKFGRGLKENDPYRQWLDEVAFDSMTPACTGKQKAFFDDGELGFLAPLVQALRSCMASMQKDISPAQNQKSFGYTSGDDFESKGWDHVYFWAYEEDINLVGWNKSACVEFPQVCECLQSKQVKPYVSSSLQWADEMTGYAALYRTAPGSKVGRHTGSFRANVHAVLQAPVGVTLTVGASTYGYAAGDVVVWEDACAHFVDHPESSAGERVVLAIKMPHPQILAYLKQYPAGERGAKAKAEL